MREHEEETDLILPPAEEATPRTLSFLFLCTCPFLTLSRASAPSSPRPSLYTYSVGLRTGKGMQFENQLTTAYGWTAASERASAGERADRHPAKQTTTKSNDRRHSPS